MPEPLSPAAEPARRLRLAILASILVLLVLTWGTVIGLHGPTGTGHHGLTAHRAHEPGAWTLLAGASVATAGTIGFVGIVAPHILRPFVKSDPARLLLPSALLAGVMLMGADLVIRLLPFDRELRLGVAAALFGAPVFIWISARLTRGRL